MRRIEYVSSRLKDIPPMNSLLYYFIEIVNKEKERVSREKHMGLLLLNLRVNGPYEKDYLTGVTKALSSHFKNLYTSRGKEESEESEEELVEKAMEFFGTI